MSKLWSNVDIEFLIANYESMSVMCISDKINRSASSINAKASRLGLKLSDIEKKYRFSQAGKKSISKLGDINGCNNPNWKGGISKNNYHYKKLQIERYPEKVSARDIVSSALRSGKLIKKPCVECGDHNSQAHHEDYSKPLDVIWLCAEHHRNRHC